MSVCIARVPLDVVTSFATRTVSARDYCLVKVRSDGQEGIGFCYVGSAGGRLAQIAVEELLAPKLIGQASLRVEGLWQEMYAESLLHGRAGSVMRAISVLDTAIWDLNARTAGVPLHAYLGSVVDDKVPAYRLYEVQNGNHIETFQVAFPQLELIEPHAQRAFDLLVNQVEHNVPLPPDQCVPRAGSIAASPAQAGHCASLFAP